MNRDLNVDQVLDSWFTEGPTSLPDRTVAAIVEGLDDVHQRGPLGLLGRTQMLRFATALGSAAVLVVVAAVAVNFYANQQGIGGPPTPSPSPSIDLGIFEPVAGRIVYQTKTGIWAVDPASSDPTTAVQLTSGPSTPLGWSSDGTRLLIQKGDENLFVLHADGSETQVTDQLSGFRDIPGVARPSGASISPDGSRVVFAGLTETWVEENSCQDGALFAVDANGGPAEVLWESRNHGTNGIVSDPAFSPDGTQIAFVDGYCDSGHSVWVMNADGTAAHQILSSETSPPGGGHVHGLAWSAAGDRIVLAESGDLYTFAPDGSGFTRIAGADTSCDSVQSCAVHYLSEIASPYWSPDGSQIAYTTGCVEGLPFVPGSAGCMLIIADADGLNPREFTFATSGPWHPGTPSPAVEPTTEPSPPAEPSPSTTAPAPTVGAPAAPSALVYSVGGDVFLTDADGSNAIRIADGVRISGAEDCAPGDERADYMAFGRAWSPDGRYLAYWDRGCPWQVRDAEDDPWGLVRITDATGHLVASFPGQGWMISWSPDSTLVAVMEVWGGPGDKTIGVYALNGIRQATLTVPAALEQSGVGDYSPVWSRDGSSILVRNVQVPLDGGVPTLFPEVRAYGAYSPDGSRYAYVDGGSLVVEEADQPDATKVSGALNEYSSAAWSPNGDLVAFEGDGTELLVRNVATGGDASLLDVTQSERVSVIEFSPGGDRIVFTRSDADGDGTGGFSLSNTSLWSIGTDGSDLRRLVDRIEWADLRPQPES